MKPYLRARLVLAGILALLFLWGCAAVGTGSRALVFTQVRGQSSEQMTLDTRACHQMGEQAPPAYDELVRPAYRNIEPRSLRIQINCMTGLGYMALMTPSGKTMDQFNADWQACVPAVTKAKKIPSGDEIVSIADCMVGRGYSVAT